MVLKILPCLALGVLLLAPEAEARRHGACAKGQIRILHSGACVTRAGAARLGVYVRARRSHLVASRPVVRPPRRLLQRRQLVQVAEEPEETKCQPTATPQALAEPPWQPSGAWWPSSWVQAQGLANPAQWRLR